MPGNVNKILKWIDNASTVECPTFALAKIALIVKANVIAKTKPKPNPILILKLDQYQDLTSLLPKIFSLEQLSARANNGSQSKQQPPAYWNKILHYFLKKIPLKCC